MDIITLAKQRHFSDEKMQKVPVFESDTMFYDQYCLKPQQAQKIHAHAGEDKVYLVLEGKAIVHIAGEDAELSAGQAAIARAGEAHGVRNASDEDVILLVTMSPKPSPKKPSPKK